MIIRFLGLMRIIKFVKTRRTMKKIHIILSLLFFLVACEPSEAEKLKQADEQIAKEIEAYKNDTLPLLKKQVEIIRSLFDNFPTKEDAIKDAKYDFEINTKSPIDGMNALHFVEYELADTMKYNGMDHESIMLRAVQNGNIKLSKNENDKAIHRLRNWKYFREYCHAFLALEYVILERELAAKIPEYTQDNTNQVSFTKGYFEPGYYQGHVALYSLPSKKLMDNFYWVSKSPNKTNLFGSNYSKKQKQDKVVMSLETKISNDLKWFLENRYNYKGYNPSGLRMSLH